MKDREIEMDCVLMIEQGNFQYKIRQICNRFWWI